ncbi:MAG: hypothetical protein HZB46_06690 [Solirubrobacterales bacterium]|nr:hypothetical protein [Solirubrobacterales bacterium]
MIVEDPDRDALLDHLQRTTGLPRQEAGRIVEDVLAYYAETAAQYVGRRHRELQRDGVVNAEAFERIAAELPRRRVAAPDLSVRQLRRLVYG